MSETVQVETAWSGPMWNGCGACNFVRRAEGRVWCAWCVKSYRELAVTLANNLAIGAALCEAHAIALDEAESHRLYHEHGYRLDGCWSPGCGKAAL